MHKKLNENNVTKRRLLEKDKKLKLKLQMTQGRAKTKLVLEKKET